MSTWVTGPQNPLLHMYDVHIWRSVVQYQHDIIELFQSLLSSDEQAREQTYVFEKDQCSFIYARGVLRTILARYLQENLEDIVFTYNQHGKPCIENSCFQFNLSHSGDYVVLAVTQNKAVGIDIEFKRQDIKHEELASRFFSASEKEKLASVPKSKQLNEFYDLWTRKEAYLKAIGTGLTELRKPISQDTQAWYITNISIQEEYSAALAIEGTQPIISYFDFE